MNIRNDLQPIQPVLGDTQVSAAPKTSGSAAAASSVTNSDQAHLSGAASLASHAASLSDVRSEKVASIQAAIAGGSYSVSSTNVAQSMMGHMLGSQQ
ncbi:MAG: flagellar biosynthesis anti-sigma factor FlgM [Silvibacterium sp.]